MKRINVCFIAALSFLLAACNKNEPDTHNANENVGRIIGTFQCYDSNREYILNGYFVEINYTDSTIHYHDALLCFNLNLKEPIPISSWGAQVIPAVAIPYDFSYRILEPGDNEYERFDPPIQTAMEWYPFLPLDVIKQVKIYTKN